MSSESKSEQIQHMLNRNAKSQSIPKRGEFEVSAEEGRLIVQWSHDQRTEQFLVKEPVTQQEIQGTVTDVLFRLKQRLIAPTVLNNTVLASPKPVKPLKPVE